MNTYIVDFQSVGETESTLFTMIQQSPIESSIILTNDGVNTINYRFQEYIQQGGSLAWVDMGLLGTDYYNTLIAGQTRALIIRSLSTQVRLVGNASGGSVLVFSVSRFMVRADGGALPIINL